MALRARDGIHSKRPEMHQRTGIMPVSLYALGREFPASLFEHHIEMAAICSSRETDHVGNVHTKRDNSSHQIIIHGGSNFDLSRYFTDTYIPSIPSFTWLKLDDGADQTELNGISCQVTRNNRLLVIGGQPKRQTQPDYAYPKPHENALKCNENGLIRILNLNKYEWEDELDIVADGDVKFKVPSTLSGIIGGEYVS